ncbi:cytochrome c [Shewanella loihica]|uniref:Cytochrome c, class I n=1 Tax=Shewanella loihica (strain ATCC BAA-1088 / PV-4) TaxID=323850 RepID=A3QIG6_SHELP|nr:MULTISPECIES: cytochrome c [Shewanella]ABO25264.1 cytochrome c, class I [Shewanella loihica PV-4]QYJ82037.1 cytochrome c [Shewanella aegiceratis]QYJ93377.1 cytochrome c [Shewanella spartinae]QYJ97262.1 cytochrome c [Shewanella alkalitolerans]QYK12518.1 cytochrome c [Shewanella rhizosphaerae]
MKKIALIAFASLMSLTAHAGDIEAGKAKSMLCAACHGADGISLAPIYPNLKGQKAQYIEKQLKAFKEGTRQDPVMAPMAMPLTDEDIANLAAYFESLK